MRDQSGSGRPQFVYCGSLFHGSTALHRLEALRELLPQWECQLVDTTPAFYTRAFSSTLYRFAARISAALEKRVPLRGTARLVVRLASSPDCKLLWLDKTIYLPAGILREVRRQNPKIRIVFYTPDDMANPGNRTTHFIESLRLYDLVVTTKSFQLDELRQWGAREVVVVDNAYDPATHRPMALTDEEQQIYGCEVGFAGAFEADRGLLMRALAEAGVSVKVTSWSVPRAFKAIPNIKVVSKFAVADDYAKAICGAKINLGFLRKANRDLQTTRSVEIPACGGFMLAERTTEHARLFSEGKEAEFFSNANELIAKCRYYLHDYLKREAIASAGRARCIASGYSNKERLAPVVARLCLI